LSAGNRDVRALAIFFDGANFRYHSYGDSAERYFTKVHRETYFEAIPVQALARSVVFFDPDNGMEPARVATEAHLRYSELNGVFRRMDHESVAVVYQHRPRLKASIFWPEVARRLDVALSSPVGYLAESDLAFYVIPRNTDGVGRVLTLLQEFADHWPQRLHVGVSRATAELQTTASLLG
jgi:hypothetical protein